MTAPYIIDIKPEIKIDQRGYTEPADWRVFEGYKQWCKEHVGPNNWNYYGQYKKTRYRFRFKRSEDLLAFKMANLL